jgi:hypothetical protein
MDHSCLTRGNVRGGNPLDKRRHGREQWDEPLDKSRVSLHGITQRCVREACDHRNLKPKTRSATSKNDKFENRYFSTEAGALAWVRT